MACLSGFGCVNIYRGLDLMVFFLYLCPRSTQQYITMTRGKTICQVLKGIRQRIADANHIPFVSHECHFEGECLGTCPACESELSYIRHQLLMRRRAGHAVALIGLASGWLSLSSCVGRPTTQLPSPSSSAGKVQLRKTEPDSANDDRTLTGMTSRNQGHRVRTMLEFEPPTIKGDVEVKAGDDSADPFPLGKVLPRHRVPPRKVPGASDSTARPPSPPPDSLQQHLLMGEVATPMPIFPGGNEALMKYLREHLRWPETDGCVQGRVVVSFFVEADGSISGVKTVRSLAPAFDREVERVVREMPHWLPAELGGEPIRTRYQLPIDFRLK